MSDDAGAEIDPVKPRRVLLVEDDRLDAQQLELELRRAASPVGFELVPVETLDAALTWLARETPDLVALDISLPDAEGEACFEAIAAAAPCTAIVVLTGRDDDVLALRLLQRGAQDYLVKGEVGPREIARCFEYAVQRARVERALADATRRAEAGSRAKATFLATMSHEIRTPLNAVLGMADLLRHSALSSEQIQYVEILQRAGQGLRDLLDNVLELSRLESGHVELRDEPFDLADLVAGTAEVFAIQAHRKRLDIVADVDASLAGRVRGDRTRVRQILSNLVANAVKFTERGSVVVRAHYERDGDAGRALVEVEDTGPGIPETRREEIFERFAQGDADTAARCGGSGLGLAICRELAERMGGSVAVSPGPEAGSVFRLVLPLPLEPSDAARGLRLDGLRVLVVDDCVSERRCYARWLEEVGALVSLAGSVAEAEALLDAGVRFDAALLDSRMPEAGALPLAESRRTDPSWPDAVVVALHLNHREGDLARILAAGARALHKPIRREALLEAIAGRAGQAAGPAASGFRSRARVLLAEDSPDNVALVRAFTRDTGLELTVVEDGCAALEAALRERFDLVLMDVSMPRLDGHEATRRIRAHEARQGLPPTPIVALSAHALPESFRASSEAGCDAHVVKPFDRATLLRAIAEHARPGFETPDVDPEIADLVPEYLARRRAELPRLRAALLANDLDAVRSLGHKMKGSGAGYGMPALSRIGGALERAAREGDLARIGHELDALEELLRVLGASGSAAAVAAA